MLLTPVSRRQKTVIIIKEQQDMASKDGSSQDGHTTDGQATNRAHAVSAVRGSSHPSAELADPQAEM